MWISGVIADRFAGFTGVRDILEPDPNSYGIDLHNPFPLHEDTVEVEVPEVNNPLTADELGRLRTIVDPLAQSSENGVDLFVMLPTRLWNSELINVNVYNRQSFNQQSGAYNRQSNVHNRQMNTTDWVGHTTDRVSLCNRQSSAYNRQSKCLQPTE